MNHHLALGLTTLDLGELFASNCDLCLNHPCNSTEPPLDNDLLTTPRSGFQHMSRQAGEEAAEELISTFLDTCR